MASSWSWVTSTVVMWTSSCRRRSQARSSFLTCASSAPNGSSSSSRRGSTARARGERHALALATRQLRRVALCKALEPHELEQLGDALADLGLRAPADLQAERDVVPDVHVPERRIVLEAEPDPPVARSQPRHVLAVDEHLPGIGHLEAGDDPEQRGLTPSARAEQSGQRARRDVEADVV